jgi:cytochrome bd-type quinol oxidase subunit 2
MSQVCVYIRDQFDLLIPLIPTALPPLYFEYRVLCGTLPTVVIGSHCEINFWMVKADAYVTRHRKLSKRTSHQMFFFTFSIVVVWRTYNSKLFVHSGWISLSTVMLNWDFVIFAWRWDFYLYRKPQEERGWCDCGRHINQADSWILVFFSIFPAMVVIE